MTIILRHQYAVFFKFRALLPCGVKYITGQISTLTEVFCRISQSIQAEG